MRHTYKLVVIGAGSGGLTAAESAVKLGVKSMALIEAQQRIGGECLHSGCVPSKALLHASKYPHLYDKPFEELHKAIHSIEKRSDNVEHLTKLGISVHSSTAKFISRNEVELENGDTIVGKSFVIATGSTPFVPPIPGLKESNFVTNENVFELKSAPRSMAIIGGGPIGCEMATAFNRLGTSVTIIQRGDRLLNVEDDDASAFITKHLADQGIQVELSNDVTNVSTKDGLSTLELEGKTISAEVILVATGRVPSTKTLDLEKAGVNFDDKGITVNKYLQTSNRHIYAVGDCIPGPRFTHAAGHQAAVALRNILFPLIKQNAKTATTNLPAITFCSPAVGSIGMSEKQAIENGVKFEKVVLPTSAIDKAVTDKDTEGYIKLLISPKNRLVGASVVAEEAAEIINILSVCYYNKLSLDKVVNAVIPYPSLATGLHEMLSDRVLERLARNVLLRIFFNR